MSVYHQENLLVRGGGSADPNLLVEVTPEIAGWDTIHFQARRLAAGQCWSFAAGGHELALVVLGGVLSVESDRGSWSGIGRRESVFAGLPYALYLPSGASFTVQAGSDAEFAVAWVAAEEQHKWLTKFRQENGQK